MSHSLPPRAASLLLALLVAGGCDQFRALKPSNSDEQPRADQPEVDDDDDRDDDVVDDDVVDSGVPTSSSRDAGSGWTHVPPPLIPPFTCSAPNLMCGSFCEAVLSSSSHCGACGQRCSNEQHCSAGECTCWGTGQIICNGGCTPPMLGMCGQCGEVAGCASEPACADGESHVADWPMLGGDLLRSGYNAGERGVPPLVKDWAVSVAPTPLNPVVVAGSRVFVSGRAWYEKSNALVALDLKTGDPVWSKDFGTANSVGAPTAADCRVYIEHGSSSSATLITARLWSLDVGSGEAIWGAAVSSSSTGYEPPMVTGTNVYAGASSYDGLFAVTRANAAPVFAPNKMISGSGEASAFYADELYTFASGKLYRRNAASGAVLDTIGVSSSSGANTRGTLASDGTAYLVAPPMAYAFEVKTKKLLWQAGSNVSQAPALAEKLVLLIDGGVLTARAAQTGALVWSASGTKGLNQAPVAAHGFAYAASATESYAVDLTTGAVVWQELGGGPLSIGAGRLFVAGNDGILRSYLLTQPPAE